MPMKRIARREFLELSALGVTTVTNAAGAGRAVVIVGGKDPVASSPPVQWAAGRLEAALSAKGVTVRRAAGVSEAGAAELCVLTGGASPSVPLAVPAAPEALGIGPVAIGGRQVLAAIGHDVRGAVFALLELADRVEHATDPIAALTISKPVVERPANKIRAVSRLFTSDVEDKPWYNDREMWPKYLDLLVSQRFNRFHLALGIGYDFIRQVTDAYFLFPYPFFLAVPGYDVRVPQLPDSERDSNLEMLRFISEQAALRGMEFQLGLWMHGYEWINSPNPNYTIAGLNSRNHGPYCRDAVRLLLQKLPAVTGATFRVHGESGVEEGSYGFWKDVFEGVATCGRTVEIDMHAKGMDQTMIDLALATRQPVKISPKYWAEHLGMPYHQANIRQVEKPQPGKVTSGLMKFSAGSRSFLRYGYGDLLREDRKWGVLHRIWPGTQRLLVWGDPLTAVSHSRAFSFCGSDGVDIMEPLSFKGRRGSGIAGDRCAYADASLRPRWDWEKYAYSHRVWGRLLYNPQADADVWQRYLRPRFGPGASAIETSLANVSRILPIVTTGHAASAGNNTYWPEVYLNQSMIDAAHPGPYTDSPAPKVFGNVSPLDPQLFSRINDYADSLVGGPANGKYSPVEVAQWIEDYAAAGLAELARAGKTAAHRDSAEYRRMAIDIELQAGLGRFFGAKFRSAVLYRIFEKTGDRAALEEALKLYRTARGIWAELAERAKPVYKPDITVGEHPQLRGHWADRLPAIDRDIETMAAKLAGASAAGSAQVKVAIQSATGRPRRAQFACRHSPPASYSAGRRIELKLSAAVQPEWVRLHYRHVTQAEDYVTADLTASGKEFQGSIPESYTDSAYPIEYYFEIKPSGDRPVLFPGFGPQQTGQPYFVVRPG